MKENTNIISINIQSVFKIGFTGVFSIVNFIILIFGFIFFVVLIFLTFIKYAQHL